MRSERIFSCGASVTCRPSVAALMCAAVGASGGYLSARDARFFCARRACQLRSPCSSEYDGCSFHKFSRYMQQLHSLVLTLGGGLSLPRCWARDCDPWWRSRVKRVEKASAPLLLLFWSILRGRKLCRPLRSRLPALSSTFSDQSPWSACNGHAGLDSKCDQRPPSYRATALDASLRATLRNARFLYAAIFIGNARRFRCALYARVRFERGSCVGLVRCAALAESYLVLRIADGCVLHKSFHVDCTSRRASLQL